MNNMKYYNESLAYDFEMFAPKTAKSEPNDNIVSMPKQGNRSRVKAAARPVNSPVLFVLMAAIAVAGFCTNIVLRAKINEVNSQINEIKSGISELESEKTSLEVEMQRRISYGNLELEAMQLGMQKPEKDNVVYIHVNDKNTATNAQGKPISPKE